MPSIPVLQDHELTGDAPALLEKVEKKLGRVPGMYRIMAHSPAVLEAYLLFAAALSKGSIGPQMAEMIALATAEFNECGYCLSAHTFFGAKAGLQNKDMEQARNMHAADDRTTAALQFVKKMLSAPGNLSTEDLRALRDKGFSDGQVLEIIANVARNIFTNYLNVVAGTEIDWPVIVRPLNSVPDAAR